jgi:hypothetical protein
MNVNIYLLDTEGCQGNQREDLQCSPPEGKSSLFEITSLFLGRKIIYKIIDTILICIRATHGLSAS